MQVASLGSPGGVTDGEYLLATLAPLHRAGDINLLAVVANQHPAAARAELARGTLRQLGVDVPVGVGTDTGRHHRELAEFTAPYAEPIAHADGHALLLEMLEGAEPNSIHLLLTSALTDARRLLSEQPALCAGKLNTITLMSGAVFAKQQARWVPDTAINNTIDVRAASRMYRALQESARPVRVRVVSRWAAYHGCLVPPAFLTELAAGGHAVAVRLREETERGINALWRSANCPPRSRGRGSLPVNRDRSWFVANMLRGVEPDRTGEEPIFDLLPALPIHDVVAGVAATLPELFDPVVEPAQPHVEVIGVSREKPGVRDPEALTAEIMRRLTLGFASG